jgi:hypothetical protein
VYRRHQEGVKINFKGLNFYLVGILLAEASTDAS